MPTESQIEGVCNEFGGSDYWVAGAIPHDKLRNARAAFGIPVAERVIALINTTVFGSNRTGLAVGTTGIYWKNDWTTDSPLSFLSWENLASRPITKNGWYDVAIGANAVFNTSGSSFGIAQVLALLERLQAISKVIQPSVGDGEAVWNVAVNGQQYGPYNLETVRAMIGGGQIQPQAALFWRQGMGSWAPLSQVIELRSLQDAQPPAIPPPIPTFAAATVLVAPANDNIVQPASGQVLVQSPSAGKTVPLIDINNAGLDDLLTLPGVTLAGAKRVMQERLVRSGFRSVDEIGQLLELAPHRVQRLRERVRIEALIATGMGTSAKKRVIDY